MSNVVNVYGRDIDLDEPLSENDREFLNERQGMPLPPGVKQAMEESDEEYYDDDEDEEEDTSEPDYDTMTNEQLREDLRGRGLSASGSKAELISRLRENDAENQSEGSEE